MADMKKVLTLQETLDYLEELSSKEEDQTDLLNTIYIEPPEIDGYNSGEDDYPPDADSVAILDNVCAEQLKSGCEVVFRSGERWNCFDEEVEKNLAAEDFTNLAINFADDEPSTSLNLSPKKAKLRKIEPKRSDVLLPQPNRVSVYTWSEDNALASLSIFPDANFEDCRALKPHEQFEKFFDEELLRHIADHSNKYAVYRKRNNPNITVNELRVVIGILIISGYNYHSNYRAMWSQNDDQRNVTVSESMRRNRYEEILHSLHFEDSNKSGSKEDPNPDKMWKLRQITDHIKANMLEHFHPEQHLSYDESMIAYFARHGCKQFLKGKPVRFGYKVWPLCTPSGYMINFEVYQGKNPRSNTDYEQRFGKCAAPLLNMIDDFADDVKNLPFSFYFDNSFTSFPLLIYLKSCGYNGTGTIRENRIPSSCPIDHKNKLKKNKRGHCESVVMKDKNIRLLKWNDNSVVCVASTCFGYNPKSNALRYSKEVHKKISVPRPCAITEYNKYMCGVHRFDQNLALYRIGYRGKKWWISIFTWLIDACIQNAWQLHRKCGSNLSQIEFRRQIAVYYCKHYGEKGKGAGAPVLHTRLSDINTVEYSLRYDRIDHFIRSCRRRRCAFTNCKSTIRTECAKCNVGLCVDYFISYHTKP